MKYLNKTKQYLSTYPKLFAGKIHNKKTNASCQLNYKKSNKYSSHDKKWTEVVIIIYFALQTTLCHEGGKIFQAK